MKKGRMTQDDVIKSVPEVDTVRQKEQYHGAVGDVRECLNQIQSKSGASE